MLKQHSAGVTVREDPHAAGIFYVTFTQDISGCVPVVSEGFGFAPDGFFPQYRYEVRNGSDGQADAHTMVVAVATDGGQSIAGSFNLIVAC